MDKVNTVYFKDGHTEEILHYRIYRENDFDCYVEFYTESGKYSYNSYYSECECDRFTTGYLITRTHVFHKYDNYLDNWLRVDIDRITLPNDKE